MRFNEPYKIYHHTCSDCGVEHETEVMNETEDKQSQDILNEDTKCFDCLDKELHGAVEEME